jgi:hypothetical protein
LARGLERRERAVKLACQIKGLKAIGAVVRISVGASPAGLYALEEVLVMLDDPMIVDLQVRLEPRGKPEIDKAEATRGLIIVPLA